MLAWIIQTTLISLVLIILIHYLFVFFKTTLTIPKVKDLVNKPTERYNDIFKTINKTELSDNATMKDELKNYLKDLSDKSDSDSPDIAPSNEFNAKNFSAY